MIDRLRELERAATPGPWERQTVGHRNLTQILDKLDHSLAFSWHGIPANTDATWIYDAQGNIASFVGNGPHQTDNGDLIAAMRNVLPLLLAVVDAARDLNMTTPDRGDTDPLSALDDALAALDAA